MSKKMSKFLLFSAVAGAAAYGAYYYLQKKDQTSAPIKEDDSDDDFDDFSEDLDEDLPPVKERSYVSLNLDKAEAFATEAFQKAKVVFNDSVQQVKETVKSVTEGNSKDIIVDVPAEEVNTAVEDAEETVEDVASEMAKAIEEVLEEDVVEDALEDVFEKNTEIPVHIPDNETIEEFFDDEDEIL